MMETYSKLYQKELTEEIIPFWEKYSPDLEYGGYFTCLLPDGQVFDTDKFIWLQARQVWMFAKFYLEISPNPKWKEMAMHGADFLEKHGRDREGNWYFSLNRTGQPLVQPYNIFSDCFAAMAFGTLYKITLDPKHAEIAKETFQQILKREKNPKGPYNKIYPGSRPLQNFALPMILCNLALELEHILPQDQVKSVTGNVTAIIMNQFYDENSGLVLENTSPEGTFVDSFEGRLLNPGHAIEAMWFIMNIGIKNNDQHLIDKAEKIMYRQLQNGWDNEFGGIYYFLDIKGHPPQQLEWDQKLWWVHLETLVALAKTYSRTKSPEAMLWFEKVHEYSWNHFRDEIHGGEWYGYLNRQGTPLLNLKGGKWKGCFHVPRAMMEIWKTFAKTP